ncbi:hypothetical protein CQ018_09870 [Arthrobacter sp. MYb227]|nr:hypothetical protein CQ018_09870 [Arthrobacter sp. MYb227]
MQSNTLPLSKLEYQTYSRKFGGLRKRISDSKKQRVAGPQVGIKSIASQILELKELNGFFGGGYHGSRVCLSKS